jgi:hypothetical protein
MGVLDIFSLLILAILGNFARKGEYNDRNETSLGNCAPR